jgi:hypothetical protein
MGQNDSPPDTGGSENGAAPPAKRSRRNRYVNCTPAVLSVSLAASDSASMEANLLLTEKRRRAQNRNSQRAYRQRKDQRIEELEGLLEKERSKHNSLSNAYAALQAEKDRLESERRSWTLYDQGSLGDYLATDEALMEQLLCTHPSGHLIDTLGTCNLQDTRYC